MVKGLRVLAVVGVMAAVLLGCQSDVTEPTPLKAPAMDDVLVVEGNIYDAISSAVIDDREVDVTWYCVSHYEEPNHFIGADTTFSGYYAISSGQDMSIHNTHYFLGKAVAAGYKDAYAHISNFQAGNMPYWRDFYMYPE